MSNTGLVQDRFLASVSKFPHRPALEVDGNTVTYAQLYKLAIQISATLHQHCDHNSVALTALFAYRSVSAFAGVLGIIFRGHGYVPLNPTFPLERNRYMLERSGCNSLIVDRSSAKHLDSLLDGLTRKMLLILPDLENIKPLAEKWPQHQFIGFNEISTNGNFQPLRAEADSIAYLLFTSGSTGNPKGVMVAHRNLRSYLDFVAPRYAISEHDRCSQLFDLTFDLSVHDMFVTWSAGACLCCPSQRQLINPGKFISGSQISTWFSVPSTVVFMKKFGTLKPNTYPLLRLSLFCGEALPMEVAASWADAAPNTTIENIYGPTELTIACTAYRWSRERSRSECHLGLVPIGEPFSGMKLMVADENLKELPVGSPGELLMAGEQVTLGYWRDPEKTEKAFVTPPGKEEKFYRTGDRVLRTAEGKPLLYLGRVDNQIKILGHRVELGEIEAAIREESGIDGVVAIGWPVSPSGASGIEVFLQAETVDVECLQRKMAMRLPSYMVPRRMHLLPRIPLNSNGKFDRRALLQILEDGKL